MGHIHAQEPKKCSSAGWHSSTDKKPGKSIIHVDIRRDKTIEVGIYPVRLTVISKQIRLHASAVSQG